MVGYLVGGGLAVDVGDLQPVLVENIISSAAAHLNNLFRFCTFCCQVATLQTQDQQPALRSTDL